MHSFILHGQLLKRDTNFDDYSTVTNTSMTDDGFMSFLYGAPFIFWFSVWRRISKKIRSLKKKSSSKNQDELQCRSTEPRYFLVAYAMTDISFFDFSLSQETKLFWGFTVSFVVCFLWLLYIVSCLLFFYYKWAAAARTLGVESRIKRVIEWKVVCVFLSKKYVYIIFKGVVYT